MPAFARKTTVKRQFGARRVPGGAIYVLYADKIPTESQPAIRRLLSRLHHSQFP